MEWHQVQSAVKRWLPNIVFWEKTNCARTEIELRNLNVLLGRCPQPTTHLAAPRWFYFLIVFMHVVTEVQTQSENVTFWTLPRVLKSIQLWHLKYLCVGNIPFISVPPVTSAHPNKSEGVQGMTSPTLVRRKRVLAMYSLSGYNTDIRGAFTTCRGSARYPAGTREPHPCFLLLVCLCVFCAPYALQM